MNEEWDGKERRLKQRFSMAKVGIGFCKMITSPAFIVCAFFNSTYWVAHYEKWVNGESRIFAIGLIVVNCIFILQAAVEKFIEKVGENTKINAEFKAGADFNGVEAIKDLKK